MNSEATTENQFRDYLSAAEVLVTETNITGLQKWGRKIIFKESKQEKLHLLIEYFKYLLLMLYMNITNTMNPE